MLTAELAVSAPGTRPGTTLGTTLGTRPATYPGFYPGTFPTPVHSPLTQAPLYGGSVPYSMPVQAPSEMVAAEQQIVARSDEMVAAAQQQEMGEAQQLEMVEGFFVPDQQQQLSEDQQLSDLLSDSLQYDSSSSSPVPVAQQATPGSACAASETEAAPQFDPGPSIISKTSTTVRAYADVHPPEPLYCTDGLRVPASCVLYVPEAQGLPPEPLGRAVRTAYCGTSGAGRGAAASAHLARDLHRARDVRLQVIGSRLQ